MLGLTLTPISKEAPGKYANQHFIQSKINVNIFQNQNFQFDFDINMWIYIWSII